MDVARRSVEAFWATVSTPRQFLHAHRQFLIFATTGPVLFFNKSREVSDDSTIDRPRSISTRMLFGDPAFAQTWHVYSQTPEGESGADYFGFAYNMRRGAYNITTFNSTFCPGDACGNGICVGEGIDTKIIGGQSYQALFGAPDSSYWNFQVSAVGKVLYDGTARFYNPRTGQYYHFIMYLASQKVSTEPACGSDAISAAYSDDGVHFVEGPSYAYIPIGANPNLLCGAWPCDPNVLARQWWTTAEIGSPLLFTGDNNYYMVAFLYRSPDLGDCSGETSLCFGTDTSHAGTGAWVLQSSDGINWARYQIDNGDSGRISRWGIDTTRNCYHAAWLINIDIAYDPATNDFYITRSYSTDYGNVPCSPAKLPDRIQVYRTNGSVGVFYGTWQLLFDGGCDNLGYQMDSATIVHDGTGNVIKGQNGSITLLVNSSGGYLPPNINACAIAPSPRYRVVIGP